MHSLFLSFKGRGLEGDRGPQTDASGQRALRLGLLPEAAVQLLGDQEPFLGR